MNSAAKAFPGEVPTLALTTGVSANGAGLGLAWSKYSTLGKREIFEKAASILRIRRDEFIKISTSETTSTEQYAKFDHFLTVSNFLETAAVVTSLKGEIAISEHGQRGYIERVPYGVVFGKPNLLHLMLPLTLAFIRYCPMELSPISGEPIFCERRNGRQYRRNEG